MGGITFTTDKETGEITVEDNSTSRYDPTAVIDGEPSPLYRRLQSKQRWSLWKKVTEQTDIRLKCALARFG